MVKLDTFIRDFRRKRKITDEQADAMNSIIQRRVYQDILSGKPKHIDHYKQILVQCVKIITKEKSGPR